MKVAGPVRLTNLFGPVNSTAEISGLVSDRLAQVIPVSGKTQIKNKFGNYNKKEFCYVKNLCGIQRCVIVSPAAVYWFFCSRHIDEFTTNSGVVDGRRLIRAERFFRLAGQGGLFA